MLALRHATAAVSVALSLVLCAPVVAQTAAPAPAVDNETMDLSTVVARVGDKEVTLGELMAMRSQLPAQYQQVPLEAIYEPMLNRAIDQILITKAARASGIADQDEVKARIEEAADQVIAEAYLTQTIAAEVTDEALRKRYEETIAGQTGDEEVKARHILLETEEAAEEVIAELEGGADFAKLAAEKSTGPSAAQGGDLGWFQAGQMVPEFSEAAFALEAGTYTKTPVKSQFGWHVILVEEKRTADAPSFEQVRDQLTAEMTRDLIQERLTNLRGAAKIERFGPTGKPLPAAQ
ncbi:peptidylprolyl isomerase [Thalassobaculum sp. OXR-137]|uniref:peptidylprolyl isomerase n=1 Tax=Thalassobaculum sp. OXR-137 TaxID=3100173 RepID=UPI002AC91510|nr:peptidylprolyl isomerase [Thalassobaculum sp. OXR-137]WPZ36087.1 peptidylprolyl isomerase [Thalassobaculum sp. OXR-137]